jgi:hypothetical protein
MYWQILLVVVIFIAYQVFGKAEPRQPRKPKPATMWDEIKFLKNVKQNLTRDYTIIVDQSGSMSSG